MWKKPLVLALAAIMLLGIVHVAMANRNGHKINYVQQEEQNADQKQKALEQIQAAEEMIAQADNLIDSLTCDPPHAAAVLLNQAKEHLANAREAFDGGKYGQAYGLATAAEMLARNAIRKIKITEDEDVEEVEEEEEGEGEQPPAEENVEQPIEENLEQLPVEENIEQPPAEEDTEQLENVVAEVLVDENSDNTPPVVHDVWVSPGVVYPPGQVDVYVHVTDDLSGVASVGISLYTPSCNFWIATGMRNKTPDGVWYETFDIPEYVEAGTWTVVVDYARDRAGNYGGENRDAATFEVKEPLILTTEIISAPSEIQSGETVAITVDVTNNTASATASGVEVYSFIGDITSSVCTVDLAPSEMKTLTLPITLNGLEPGTYTLGVVAKYENQVSEAEQQIWVGIPTTTTSTYNVVVIAFEYLEEDPTVHLPISGAAIYVDEIYRGTTSVDGSLEVTNLAAGTHYVRAEKAGYVSSYAERGADGQLHHISPMRLDVYGDLYGNSSFKISLYRSSS